MRAILAAAGIGACALVSGWIVSRWSPAPLVGLDVALSLVTTPYISSYDHLVLVLPWATTLTLAMRVAGAARGLLLLGILASASLLPSILFADSMTGGSPTWSVAVPISAALLLGSALRVVARSA